MRVITLIILLFFKTVCSLSQTVNDTNSVSYHKIWLGVTNYTYAYNFDFEFGTSALGISLYIPAEKFVFQVGLLMDLRNYAPIELRRYNGVNTGVDKGNPNLRQHIFPLLLHYTITQAEKINFFMTAGFIIGGNNYLNNDGEVLTAGSPSYIVGAGVSYNILRKLYLRAEPTVRFNLNKDYENRIVFPGILIDVAFDLSFKETKRPL